MPLNSFLENTYPFSFPLRCKFSILSSQGAESPVFETQTFKKITLASQKGNKKLKRVYGNKLLLFPESLAKV